MPNIRSNKTRVRAGLIALLAGLVLGVAGPRLWAAEQRPDAPRIHVVSEGETLWSLSRRYASGEDPRGFVYRVSELNHLGTAPILPGQRLRLP